MKGIKHNNPMQTRHGRTNWKSHSVVQLKDALEKTSTPKVKHKIQQELNRKLSSI